MRGKIFYGTMGGESGSSSSIFLQPAGGGPISGTLQQIADNAGNNSALWLSNAAANIGSGTITSNGVLTVKGAGGNVQSWRNSSNVEIMYVDSGGGLWINNTIRTTDINLAAGQAAIWNNAGIVRMTNSAFNDFTRLILGSNDTNGISIVKNAQGMHCMLGNGLTYAAFRALSFQSEKLSSGSLADSYPFRVGDIGAITDASLLALGLNRQIAIENKGQICYIPFSSSLIP